MSSLLGGSLIADQTAGQSVSPDEDLGWIMESFVGRLGANAGSLAYQTADMDWERPLVTVGDAGLMTVFSRSPNSATVITRAEPSSNGICWDQDPASGRKRLTFRMPAAYNSHLIINAVYAGHIEIATSAAEVAAERLRPVLSGYFRLWSMLRAERQRMRGLEAASNASGVCFFMLDADANLMFANRQAHALLASNDGLRQRGKSITATSLDEAYRLHILIDHVISSHGCPAIPRDQSLVTISRSGTRRPLTLYVHPTVEKPLEQKDPAALLHAIDPELDLGPLIAPVCQLYKLSRIETQLVQSLLDGDTISQSALKLRLGLHTARSYLKQIFIKTDTNRQADLVRLMLSSLINIRS